ncbi:hypothetical protein K439DRAFT_1661752 [Ramaria rubella]|nr:hypothetical protein K439DRAFT_1661752 [Ramaria rubella]
MDSPDDPFKFEGGIEDSPLFLSSGEDTSTSSSSNSSSHHSGSPRLDWTIQGSMRNQILDSKPQANDDLDLDFSSTFPRNEWPSMDMDIDISAFMHDPSPNFSIDPSALHFDHSIYGGSQDSISAIPDYDSVFKFTLSQPSGVTQAQAIPLQLPTPKPSSTSSRSVSPVPSKSDQDSSAGVNPSDLSLISLLGQKARDAVGITLAVPTNGGVAETVEKTPITPVSPVSIAELQNSPPKVPIPRLRAPSFEAQKQSSLTTLSPPSSHPSPSLSTPQETITSAPTKAGRPKTSHTTIERRYRTNLNARILALRRAVPALRILEKNTATRTQGKGLTGASAPKWDFGEPSILEPTRCPLTKSVDDVVNERGYVDGVKAAKKNSKGVVLGKAVEYIKALKRREIRLQREAAGLRELLSGLVGGPDLLREWEKEWRERFGGEEADEVDEDEDGEEEGDAEDGDDGDSDEEEGRQRKRVRSEKMERKTKSSATPVPPGEKRKRGRPRKNPIADVPALKLQPPSVQDERQPSKYLLAVFLLFNFFSPQTPASTHSTAHEGTVLTHGGSDTSKVPIVATTGWTALQAVNMVVSLLLLVSLVGAYLPTKFTRAFPRALFLFPPLVPVSAPKAEESASSSRSIAISCALEAEDGRALRDALRADGSLYAVVKALATTATRSVKRLLRSQRRGKDSLPRRESVQLRGWRSVAQAEALHGKQHSSLLMKIQAYLTFSSHLPASPAAVSPRDNITLALLAYHFSQSTATELWESAKSHKDKTAVETLVLELDVEDAVKIVQTLPLLDSSDGEELSPVHRIAAHVVLNRAKTLAARQFVVSVSGLRVLNLYGETGENTVAPASAQDEVEAKTVVAAGKELGGSLGDLTSLLDKVGRCSAAAVLATLPDFEAEVDEAETEPEESESSSSDGFMSGSSINTDAHCEDTMKDTRLFLLATLLYRRIFPTANANDAFVPSPPPSPTPKSVGLHLTLRRTLASTAFDTNPDTEEARDRVVDVLCSSRLGGRTVGLR